MKITTITILILLLSSCMSQIDTKKQDDLENYKIDEAKMLLESVKKTKSKTDKIHLLTKVIELNPKEVEAYRLRSDLYLDINKFDLALTDNLFILDLIDNDSSAIYSIGEIYMLLGKLDDAQKYYLINYNSLDPRIIIESAKRLSIISYLKNDIPSSISYINFSLKLEKEQKYDFKKFSNNITGSKNYFGLLLDKAYLLTKIGKYDEAFNEIYELLDINIQFNSTFIFKKGVPFYTPLLLSIISFELGNTEVFDDSYRITKERYTELNYNKLDISTVDYYIFNILYLFHIEEYEKCKEFINDLLLRDKDILKHLNNPKSNIYLWTNKTRLIYEDFVQWYNN